MNRNKRRNCYDGKTVVGIHTGNGVTRDMFDLEKANMNPFVGSYSVRKVRNENESETYLRVNPNKHLDGYIDDAYSKFKKIMQDVFEDLEVKNFTWRRIDLSFNTMDENYYQNYAKLNRLLIACLANSASDDNTYDTKNFWNGKTKSLATKNGYREVEFYDKNDESNGASPYYSRLELRSKRMSESIEHEFLEIWFGRLDRALEQFESVQNRFNVAMAEVYLEDLAKCKKDRDFLNINSFLMTRRDYIFTSNQLKNLLVLLGFKEDAAKTKAYNFKKDHNIEYFTKQDLQCIVTEIKKRIIDYFTK